MATASSEASKGVARRERKLDKLKDEADLHLHNISDQLRELHDKPRRLKKAVKRLRKLGRRLELEQGE
jgi:hypothetical protein